MSSCGLARVFLASLRAHDGGGVNHRRRLAAKVVIRRERQRRIFGETSSLRAVFPQGVACAGSLGFSENFLPSPPPIRLPELRPAPNRGP